MSTSEFWLELAWLGAKFKGKSLLVIEIFFTFFITALSLSNTVPQYPKNSAIAPGEKGEITVIFDSSNKPGMQQKSVTLSANTASGREMLRIKSQVTPDPVKQQQREAQAKARQ